MSSPFAADERSQRPMLEFGSPRQSAGMLEKSAEIGQSNSAGR
jgi:hypothetical protein